MTLDQQAKTVMEEIKKIRTIPLSQLPLPEARSSYRKLIEMAGLTGFVHKVEDKEIPVKDSTIKIRIYTPEGNGPFPILIYYHGGGWVLGDLEISDGPCREIATKANCIVISVDYRLAPEFKFPTAVNDSYAAYNWVKEHAHHFNGDVNRIAVGGDSAGGNLAAAVTLLAKEAKDSSILFQLLIYPVSDISSFDSTSYIENGEGYYLTRDSMMWYANNYIKTEADSLKPLASPLLAEDVSGLPPALIITAEYDPLRDDGENYAKRLKAHGVPIEYICFEGMIHAFVYMAGAIDKGKEAITLISERLRSVFSVKV